MSLYAVLTWSHGDHEPSTDSTQASCNSSRASSAWDSHQANVTVSSSSDCR